MKRRTPVGRSRAQEDRLAKSMGGVRHGGSGSGPWRKNDLRTERYLVEAKTRVKPDAKQITIRLADLLDVARNAAIDGRIPILAFELGGVDYCIIAQTELNDAVDPGGDCAADL